MKIKEVRGMKAEERLKRLDEFRLELAKLKGSSAVGASIKEPGKVKELRKAIATILTVNKEGRKGGKEA
ncbi:MAG: 50S ribosomal protein L29 [Candidatus Aenigmarchaeota archaeon]|nr:50S ribosomal protein L29 [Candidatus Aenigmarchaeota archaeon]